MGINFFAARNLSALLIQKRKNPFPKTPKPETFIPNFFTHTQPSTNPLTRYHHLHTNFTLHLLP